MKALITGIYGQDGTYLTEFLLAKGYEVHGIARRAHQPHPRAGFIPPSVRIHEANVIDLSSLLAVQREVAPDEIYHLAAESHVGRSFKEPAMAFDVTGGGTLNVLEAVRLSGIWSRIYIASTSEMFGGMSAEPCSESTPFHPRSPYGVAKLAGHSLAVVYREAYKLYVSCGILFNHESERRSPEFVTRKITQAVAKIVHGSRAPIRLGNLDARRDWGYAPDYVRGMWMMLQQPHPDDFVLATGETHSIRDFLTEAFQVAGLDEYSRLVTIDPLLYRPAEVNVLLGDATKARTKMGWAPSTTFPQLVEKMVLADLGT